MTVSNGFYYKQIIREVQVYKKYKMGKSKLELPIYNKFSVIFTQSFINPFHGT